MARIVLLIVFTLLTQSHILACSCGSDGAFIVVSKKSRLVALVKVNKYLTFKNINETATPLSMEVEIIDIYKGSETRKTITVWGDNGILCRPYLSEFEAGKYFVIAFNTAHETSRGLGSEGEKPEDYSISICGIFSLAVDSSRLNALGGVTDKERVITLTDLKSRIRKE